MEVGPFRTVPASKTASGQVELELVEGGWEEFGTIVFSTFLVHSVTTPGFLKSRCRGVDAQLCGTTIVDQPPGTGYSTVPTNGYLHELGQASAHLIKFLENFYEVFPELREEDVSYWYFQRGCERGRTVC